MLNERYIRAHPDEVRAALRRRETALESEAMRTLDEWLALDARRRESSPPDRAGHVPPLHLRGKGEPEARQASPLQVRGKGEMANRVGASGGRPAQGEGESADSVGAHGMRPLPDEGEPAAAGELASLASRARAKLLRIPNLPAAEAPDETTELRRWGEPRSFEFAPQRHDELAAALGILDLPRATKLAGPRFPLLIGPSAQLVRALAALMLDRHAARGYVEVAPPHLLRAATLEGTGHLPRHEEELYAIPRDGLYLSPTAEAQLVALHAGETLPAARLPLAYTAWTPCYRREAGSAGAATRGLIRQHQFEKVELVRIATAEGADAAFAAILEDAEAVLRALELPYRAVALAARDLPFASRRTVDLEVWMPGQGRYVEISSVSDCGDFQARRLGLRYKPSSGRGTQFAHTLNGSALAIGRTLAALLENGQRPDGSVALPEALAGYLPQRELRGPSRL